MAPVIASRQALRTNRSITTISAVHDTSEIDAFTKHEPVPDSISVDRCRELLGDEALTLTDTAVDAIRSHARSMAQGLVETVLGLRRAGGG